MSEIIYCDRCKISCSKPAKGFSQCDLKYDGRRWIGICDRCLDGKRHARKLTNKKYHQKNKEKINRANTLKRYGLSIDEYNVMLENQQHVCKMCALSSDKILVVDHCHATGAVRGLLCHKCNVLLGMVGDNIDILHKAIDYLRR